jgi:CheY-like chemotaxis protein
MLNSTTRPKQILIVDDEATLVFFFSQSLRDSYPDYTIDSAASGEDAINLLTYNQYDLLITDLKMPGISGFTLSEVARSLQPGIKIIIMTAYGSRDIEQSIAEAGIEGYLTKPFPTARLQELATRLLADPDAVSDSAAQKADTDASTTGTAVLSMNQ